MAKYQASLSPNVPLNFGNVVCYVLDGTNWLSLGAHDNFTFTWNVETSESALSNCKLPKVINKESVTVKLSMAQYFQKSFVTLLGGIVDADYDGSGNVTKITTGGATDEVEPVRMRFVHEAAGGGGVYWDVYKVSYSGSGDFEFQDDESTDKPQMVTIELTGDIDSDRTDGDQLFSMAPFSGEWAQPSS
jgi:hypothetical protein